MKNILMIMAILLSTLQAMADTGHTYTLFSDGMPSDAVVVIGGQEFRGLNAQGDQSITLENLTAQQVQVRVGGGYLASVSVDNANYQVNVHFIQFFIPTQSADAPQQYPYLLKMPMAYIRRDGTNLRHTTDRSQADRFLFIEKEQGQYYLYDLTARQYITYNAATNGSSVTATTASNVRYIGMRSAARTWQLLLLSPETVAIIPGSIPNPTTESPALNFTGGINAGCVLNLWTASDQNSAWQIIDPAAGSMPCATLMYSLPGAEYMHKLVTDEGQTVTSIDFQGITTLTLNDGRLSQGNHYKYVHGTAPTDEGEYQYTVHLSDGQGQQSQVRVRLIVSRHLQSPTPMMAWLTWNWFARSISHQKMVDIAQGMQRHGLIDAGFNTIVLDDAWAAPTTDKSALTYDRQKFPQGISGLKTALQAVNPALRLGIYSDAGSMTCENYQPGSYQYEAQHLALFDQWGVDMLKYDYCNSEASTRVSYTAMGDAVRRLNETRQAQGREPFVFNICEWGKTQPWLWGAEAGGSSWRSTSDAREDWVGNSSRPGVLAGVDETRRLWMYAGVNRYNDLDMMCIGLHGLGGPSNNTMSHMQNGGRITGLTDAQARTQMSLWCMLASPLALTCDLRATPHGEANSSQPMPTPLITQADVQTLTNAEILAINQDALGQQAEYMEHLSTGADYSSTGYDVYVKDLTGGRLAVAVTNRGSQSIPAIVLPLTALYMQAGTPYTCRDVWAHTTGTVRDTLSTGTLSPCQTKVFLLTPAAGTPVRDVTGTSASTTQYDLHGRQVQDARTTPIVIRNGRKAVRRRR